MKENKTEKRNATQRKERRQIRRSAHRYHNKNNNNARASSAQKERGRDRERELNSPPYPVGHLDTSCVLPTKKNSPGSSPLVVQPQRQLHGQPWPGPGQHLANAKSLEIVFSSLRFFFHSIPFSPFPLSLFPPELPQPGA